MGLFFSEKPKVSSYELKKVRSRLYSEGFGTRKLAEFDKIFSSGLSSNEGIDAKELESTIAWLRQNKSKHIFEDQDIAKIEEAMRSKI